MSRFIDIHTHRIIKPSLEKFSLYSIRLNDVSYIAPDQAFSVGIHPWDAELANENLYNKLRELSSHKNCIAIGESGLDFKHHNSDLTMQNRVFDIQIALAAELRKPIIIHCVGDFNQVFKKLAKYNVKSIFHGFHGSKIRLDQALKLGSYLSLNSKSIYGEGVKSYPLDRIFLESDDQDIEIENLYEQLAFAREMSIESLKCKIEENFKSVFNE